MEDPSPPPPPSLAERHSDVVRHLAALEAAERTKALPHVDRAPDVEIGDRRRPFDDANDDGCGARADGEEVGSSGCASLRRRGLRIFGLALLPVDAPSSYAALVKLDVSNNELSALPGLASLAGLEELSLQRNWFNALPEDIGLLLKLRTIDASRNFLKPNSDSLRWEALRRLPQLQKLDVRYNQKICRAEHRERIREALRPRKVQVMVTVWEEMAKDGEGANDEPTSAMYVGASAAHRDPTLLLSQLEPWGTVQLRRRLVRDFGRAPTDPNVVDRGEVMRRLLECYRSEGLLRLTENADDEGGDGGVDLDRGVGTRKVVRVDGTPVREELLRDLLAELREWRGNNKRGGASHNRERPSIDAQSYMILRRENSGDEGGAKVSRRARRMHKKMERNQRLWDLALKALEEVDPTFAEQCSEIAVTYGFTGSPHIDKQNAVPFYGLALGDFAEGTGCVVVECSARVVAVVNTKGRLGRVDGRCPHWVSPYEAGEERFSLIYYDTASRYRPPGPAIFALPDEEEEEFG